MLLNDIRPKNLKIRIFLDSDDVAETRVAFTKVDKMLLPITYQNIDLSKPWQEHIIRRELPIKVWKMWERLEQFNYLRLEMGKTDAGIGNKKKK